MKKKRVKRGTAPKKPKVRSKVPPPNLAISENDQEILKTLLLGFNANRLAMLKVYDLSVKRWVTAICGRVGEPNAKTLVIFPLATLVRGNPYDYLIPPAPLAKHFHHPSDEELAAALAEEETPSSLVTPEELPALLRGLMSCANCRAGRCAEHDPARWGN